MTKREALKGKPYAGNPHVRFDEGEVASTTSRRGSLRYKLVWLSAVLSLFARVVHSSVFDSATFMLDVRGDLDGNKSLGTEEIGNALTYREDSSFVSGFTPIFSPGAKELPSIKQTIEGEVSNPYWGGCNHVQLSLFASDLLE